VRTTFREIHITLATLGSVIHSITAEGECYRVHRTVTVRHRGTNAVGDVSVVHWMRFREGRLIAFSEYPDTAMLAQLAGEVEVA
jgi:ketosteroid isomerase-like protein